MKTIDSREYKVMIDHHLFEDRKTGLDELEASLHRIAGLVGIGIDGEFKVKDKRIITFLDTPDSTLLRNRLILRFRANEDAGDESELTLKCRLGDQYIAAETDISSTQPGEIKFEEDIGPPFCSRYSHSNTLPCATPPDSVGKASDLYPLLRNLRRDGATCHPSAPLIVVGNDEHYERVCKGVDLKLAEGVKGSVAVILWSTSAQGRLTCAELSFRYKNVPEAQMHTVADRALQLWEAIQQREWYLPDALTKTQFAYRGAKSG